MKQAIVVLTVLYLAAGVPILVKWLDGPSVSQAAATTFLTCAGCGILGCIVAIAGKRRPARWLVLPAMGVVSLAVAWPPDRWFVYPSFLTAPLMVFLRQGDGTTYRLGVSALPAALFIALWFALRAPPPAPRKESVNAVGVESNPNHGSPG